MSNVLTFRPRAPQAQTASAPSPAAIRAQIEEAAQAALDTADSLLAILDRMDGDAGAENGRDAEPALSAPETHGGQVVWLRGNDEDREAEAPAPAETVLPIAAVEGVVIPFAPLPWGGSGNVVAAAGVALFNMVGGR